MYGSTGQDDDPTQVIRLDRRPLMPRRRIAVLAAALIVIAAVLGWSALSDSATDNRLLVVDEDGAISLVDPATGEALFQVPDATATPDRSALLTTEPAVGGGTVLESRDPASGTVTGSTRLDGAALTVRTVSPKGQAVALMPGPRGGGIFEPEGRERTSLTVSYLDDRSPRTFELDGNLEPEMFSYDETGLYVIELVPPDEPDSYYVRRLDLESGTLTDTGAPQVGLNPKMRGRARASVLHPTGDQLFTLYTLPASGDPVFDPEDSDTPVRAFIHVIDLKEDWSFCVFLPEPLGTGDETTVGMGISPDGAEVVVVDPSTSTLVRVDATELEVVETIHVEQLRDGQAPASVAVADADTVYVGSGPLLLELTRPSLQVTRVWSQQGPVSGVSLSASGNELRVGGGGSITILDRASGQETAVLEAPGRGTVTLLGPPRGSVSEFPLECAC